jgi:hypothetical protein
MSAEATQTDGGDEQNNDPQELADKHDGVGLGRDRLQGTFTYVVNFDDYDFDDADFPDSMTHKEFAKNLAVSRLNKELDAKFTIRQSGDNVVAEETDAWDSEEYRVMIRFETNC